VAGARPLSQIDDVGLWRARGVVSEAVDLHALVGIEIKEGEDEVGDAHLVVGLRVPKVESQVDLSAHVDGNHPEEAAAPTEARRVHTHWRWRDRALRERHDEIEWSLPHHTDVCITQLACSSVGADAAEVLVGGSARGTR
jgi:hypothetical protein